MSLVQLYKEMSDLTSPVCAHECKAPHSCCDQMYCEMADAFARENGVILERTNHSTLFFMSPIGCVVPPHLRPLCTLHLCCINSLGFKPNDLEFTKKYFKLRAKIEKEELKNEENKNG